MVLISELGAVIPPVKKGVTMRSLLTIVVIGMMIFSVSSCQNGEESAVVGQCDRQTHQQQGENGQQSLLAQRKRGHCSLLIVMVV